MVVIYGGGVKSTAVEKLKLWTVHAKTFEIRIVTSATPRLTGYSGCCGIDHASGVYVRE